ncbi:MAG: IclR family transcriptional regulator [Atribacterota bacterium]|nr:IclR family transcriptional regulator [Atribacterota bacterium]
MKVIKKLFRILNLFTLEKPSWRIAEISKTLDLNHSTVFRVLKNLREEGYVIHDVKTREYRLGLKFLEMGSIVVLSLELFEKARPILKRLAKIYDGTVLHLTILEGFEVIYLDKIESIRSFPMNSRQGRHGPLYCTGVGKALLAYLPVQEIDHILKNINLIKYTKNTITNVEELKKELEVIRKRGYAIDNEEISYGLKCIAGPIRDYSGKVIASISIAASPLYFKEQDESSMIKTMVDACKEISSLLGYNIKYHSVFNQTTQSDK